VCSFFNQGAQELYAVAAAFGCNDPLAVVWGSSRLLVAASILLKPNVTTPAAEAYRFDIRYRSRPCWVSDAGRL
jgi:hypothetical protein